MKYIPEPTICFTRNPEDRRQLRRVEVSGRWFGISCKHHRRPK